MNVNVNNSKQDFWGPEIDMLTFDMCLSIYYVAVGKGSLLKFNQSQTVSRIFTVS